MYDALELRPLHRHQRWLQELQLSHQIHRPHLANKAATSEVWYGRIVPFFFHQAAHRGFSPHPSEYMNVLCE